MLKKSKSFKNQELESINQGVASHKIAGSHQPCLQRYMDVMAVASDLSLITCIAKARHGNLRVRSGHKVDGSDLYSINIGGADYCLFFRVTDTGLFFDLDYGPDN